ncbi:MAG: DUF58 domain-containing protein [SAR324 cluster bacterium]|nr:DUF58 domain-containing protein [SAR324 cluster bacterium]
MRKKTHKPSIHDQKQSDPKRWWKLKLWFPQTNRGLQFTKVGFWFTIITTLLGIGAINTGINTLYIALGFFLNGMILSGWLSERVMRHFSIELSASEYQPSGENIVLKATVRNSHHTLPIIGLHILIPEWDTNHILPVLPPDTLQTISLTGNPLSRGIYRQVTAECRTQFPFGLFDKFKRMACHFELVIPPARYSVRLKSIMKEEFHENQEHNLLGDHEFFQLKPYQSGDSVRHIHWKKTAASLDIILNEYTRPQAHETFHFYCDPLKATTLEDYEIFLSRAFSLTSILLEKQQKINLWGFDGQCRTTMEEIGFWLADLPDHPHKLLSAGQFTQPENTVSLYELFEREPQLFSAKD